jgi:hypothetical protein
MKLEVWLLEHRDIEDDKYVRGIFRSEAAASAAMTQHEVSPDSWRPTFHRHGDWCCIVSREIVLDEPEQVYHGPEVPYMGPLPRPRTIWDDMADHIMESLTRPSIFDIIRATPPGEPKQPTPNPIATEPWPGKRDG